MKDLINASLNVLTEGSLQEKLFRSVGALAPSISKAASEFMKNNKKMSTREEFDKAWKKDVSRFNDTIVNEIFKKIPKDDIVYITTNVSKVKWKNIRFRKDIVNKAILNGDVYVNIGIKDDVNGKPLAKKVKGWINPAINVEDEVYEYFQSELTQNIELKDTSLGFIIED
tara:strand:+ start:10006 stop:10515 length:510 start_codon:yes stop_codon:yes gene_type:complete